MLLITPTGSVAEFKMPVYATEGSAAFDIYAPVGVNILKNDPTEVGLGFKAVVPEGYAAILAPRSGLGFKYGVELSNTIGVIDSDYRGEWVASLVLKQSSDKDYLYIGRHERFLQCFVVPILRPELCLTSEEGFKQYSTQRGEGGMGSTGRD